MSTIHVVQDVYDTRIGLVSCRKLAGTCYRLYRQPFHSLLKWDSFHQTKRQGTHLIRRNDHAVQDSSIWQSRAVVTFFSDAKIINEVSLSTTKSKWKHETRLSSYSAPSPTQKVDVPSRRLESKRSDNWSNGSSRGAEMARRKRLPSWVAATGIWSVDLLLHEWDPRQRQDDIEREWRKPQCWRSISSSKLYGISFSRKFVSVSQSLVTSENVCI